MCLDGPALVPERPQKEGAAQGVRVEGAARGAVADSHRMRGRMRPGEFSGPSSFLAEINAKGKTEVKRAICAGPARLKKPSFSRKHGGRGRARTGDPLLAKQIQERYVDGPSSFILRLVS